MSHRSFWHKKNAFFSQQSYQGWGYGRVTPHLDKLKPSETVCTGLLSKRTLAFYKSIIFSRSAMQHLFFCARVLLLCSYTNKDNLEWQQSILPPQKVNLSRPLALAGYWWAVLSKIKVDVCFHFFFFFFPLKKTRGWICFFQPLWHLCTFCIVKTFHYVSSGKPLMPENQLAPTPLSQLRGIQILRAHFELL